MTTLGRFLVCATLGSGCVFEPVLRAELGDGDDDGPEQEEDADGDGFATPEDCDDDDALVFPGQTAFFTEPSAAGSFDYDCNGTDELEIPSLTTCKPPVCGEDPGWNNLPIPACGDEGSWVSGYCQHEGRPDEPPYCSGGDIPVLRTQGCR